jgi:hypothetical protein
MRQGADNLTSSLAVLNSHLSSELMSVNESPGGRLTEINSTGAESVLALNSSVGDMFSRLQRLVLDLAREVYSPLEVDKWHPESIPPPVPLVAPTPSSSEDDRYQCIDRLKRNKRGDKDKDKDKDFCQCIFTTRS